MSTQLDEHFFDNAFFQQKLPQYYRAIIRDFRKASKSFVTFNLLFFLLFGLEVFSFFFFLSFLIKSSIFAIALATLLLTGLSYFVLLLYFQAKKPEEILLLKTQFLKSCRQIIQVPEGESAHHLALADALMKLADYFQDFEWNFYKIPSGLSRFNKTISRFSAYCYGKDVHQMKVLLLQAAVEEHLKQIRLTPTDLELHASLANAYVSLSKVYRIKDEKEKSELCLHLALEEFSILNNYAPQDPWVHEQLAEGYRDLKMVEEEIREIEILLDLRPQDNEILHRLGLLYFQKGLNAKGLCVYEKLKKANYRKAEDLITSYGKLSF